MLKGIIVLFFLISMPAFAGVYEDAMSKQNKVFLYLYTNDCSMCKSFMPIYEKLAKNNKNYTFVKVDANTRYGLGLMRKFRSMYVPFVVLSSPKTKKHAVINPYCLFDTVCSERAMNGFKG